MADCRRLKLILSYDGRDFAGWQRQKNAPSVQESLELTLSKLCGRPVSIFGAGRTDAGVHALGQCAHADVPAARLTPEEWLKAANALLPPTVRVVRTSFVAQDFHARFSAKEKIYRYRIVTGAVLSPFEVGRAWHVAALIDHALLLRAASLFVGEHDFGAFAARRYKRPEMDTVRTIRALTVRRSGRQIELEFAGPGFLYKMVRMIVGALMRCSLGKEEIDTLRLHLQHPALSNRRFVAPAEGLYLVRIQY